MQEQHGGEHRNYWEIRGASRASARHAKRSKKEKRTGKTAAAAAAPPAKFKERVGEKRASFSAEGKHFLLKNEN